MIDSFHRIRSLSNAGVKIHLHAFEYGRSHSKELESLCSSVNYYPRDTSFLRHISFLPYSVISRRSDKLTEDLLKDEFPVLFDGIQTTLSLNDPALSKRIKAVRIHNIEPYYYRSLARYEKKLNRKLYYFLESRKLERYEKILKNSDFLLTVSFVDHDYYNRKLHNSIIIPSSHPYDKVDIIAGKGDFILYHGDLSVNENIAVSEFLIKKVFSKIGYRCIIAGKNPPASLAAKVSRYENISLIPDPDNERMHNLIRDAHINILPTMATNGLKLKLLISLYSGRHCIVNSTTINGSGLYSLCHIVDTAVKMILKINSLMDQPFSDDMIEERKKILANNYDNISNSSKLMALFFPDKESVKQQSPDNSKP